MGEMFKKIKIGFLLAIFISATLFGSLFSLVKSAKAQAVTIASYPFYEQESIRKELAAERAAVAAEITKNKNFMIMNAVVNAMSYFANKISYDMAVWLASGGKGQAPFANTKGFFSYMAEVAGDSIGESLGSLSESLGLNICDLPDPRLDLALQLGLHFKYEEPKPKCKWQDLKKAYSVENFQSKYLSQEGTLGRLSASVTVKDTDFGIWTDSRVKIDGLAVEKQSAAQSDREEGSGIKAMTDLISGQVKTPSVVMKDQLVEQAASGQLNRQQAKSGAEVWGAFGAGATQVGYKAASTFISTLLGTVLKNFMEQGMLPGGKKICNPGLTLTGIALEPCQDGGGSSLVENYYSGSGSSNDNRRAAQEMFSELLIPKIKTLENYNVIGSLAECSVENKSPDACVADQSFIQILQAADSGELLSVKQAIEKGWLHGDWKLISPLDEMQNTKWNCAEEAYCYSNLKVLRKLRILPIGFEIAASLASVDSPPTLKNVVDGFYNCNSQGKRDGEHPYCHLIYPHWVIKLPKLRCNAQVYGSIANNGARMQECADLQHCVGLNKDGSCLAYGYCLKEQHYWTFDADYCDTQYSTCRVFSDSDGNSAAYLTRTLDTSDCNQQNDGCRRYSAVKLYTSADNSTWLSNEINYNAEAEFFFNNSLYFNNKLTVCEVKDDGCSAFKVAKATDTMLYLRKAPDYLGCYDADNKTALEKLKDGVQWPQTIAELNLIAPQNEDTCKKYAQVCLPEEENCNLYTSELNQEVIPGKFKPAQIVDGQLQWNDQCDAKCVGYAAYREMPSNYANGEDLTYIIPSSGKICEPHEEGCASFTNLSGAGETGMEQTEFFSYLRPCILPDQNKQKTFYVYESTESGGYKLQTFVLEKDSAGAPKQIFHDLNEQIDNLVPGRCDVVSYSAGTAVSDCHQFNDDAGHIFYRLLSKTILVSENCTPYRLNNTELVDGQCPFDFDINGQRVGDAVEKKNNACFYYGLPSGNTRGAGETRVCSAKTATCRAYKGNAGNNVRVVLRENFETGQLGDWNPNEALSLSRESNQINGHSLKYFGKIGFSRDNLVLNKGKSYILTFWAKGNAKIKTLLSSEEGNVSLLPEGMDRIVLSDVWHYYTFGPVEFETAATGASLWFSVDSPGAKSVFLDNITLTEITDYVYLIKNSLSVDSICDSDLNDNLPGEALGCSLYKDPLKNNYYLTNFSYLCRETAVGCTAVLDTYNTLEEEGPRAYNVWLTGAGGSMTETQIKGNSYSCQIPKGQNGCYVNIFGQTIEDIRDALKVKLTTSTVYIPSDTPSAKPIYLVANKNAACKQENMGCQAVGKSALQSPEAGVVENYEEIAVINNPALYDITLCQSEAVGCKSWQSGQSNYYFKDPKLIGKTECVYKNEIKDGKTYFGWYLKDHKRCLAESINSMAEAVGKICSTDSECAAFTINPPCPPGGSCPVEYYSAKCEIAPCYPQNQKTTGEYGIWSFGNTSLYKGYVGSCPEEQSGCTEFIDRSGAANKRCVLSGIKCEIDGECEIEGDFCELTDESAYYLLDNEKLQNAQNKCNGLISLVEGCALFDKTDQPNKFWDTDVSYMASQNNNDKLTAPVFASDKNKNDANMILKVNRDRRCSEWAYCSDYQKITNPDTGEVTTKCYNLGVCKKAAASTGMLVKGGRCDEVVTANWADKGRLLTAERYVNRSVAWNAEDYSGYSLYDSYQIPDLKVRFLPDGNVSSPDGSPPNCPGGSGCVNIACLAGQLFCGNTVPVLARAVLDYKCLKTDYKFSTLCGFDNNGDGKIDGRCFGGECIYDISSGGKTGLAGQFVTDKSETLSCRAYPEETSPFGQSVYKSTDPIEFKSSFEGVNVCADKAANESCDCSYNKYKTDEGYYYTSKILDAADNLKSLSVQNGWQGYCVERDERQKINGINQNNCLTWWPVEVVEGASDIWMLDPAAAYDNALRKDRYLCLHNSEKSIVENFEQSGWSDESTKWLPTCAAYVKISDSQGIFKPVAWRLVKNEVNLMDNNNDNFYPKQKETVGNWVAVAGRVKELGGLNNYGLMSLANLSAVINPFTKPVESWGDFHENQNKDCWDFSAWTSWDGTEIFPLNPCTREAKEPKGSVLEHYQAYQGGVPLMASVRGDVIPSWFSDVSCQGCLPSYEKIADEQFADFKPADSELCKFYDTPYCRMFSRMFAEVLSSSNLTDIPVFDATTPKNSIKIRLNIFPPTIAAPVKVGDAKFELNNISVNNKNSGNVILTGAGDDATIHFYAWADPQQMPLRRILVKKGDGSDPLKSEEISIANRKSVCAVNYCNYNGYLQHWQFPCAAQNDCLYLGMPSGKVTCAPPSGSDEPGGFGNTTDQGCLAVPFEFHLSYNNCSNPATVDSATMLTTEEKQNLKAKNIKKICYFKPAAQVMDNWEWCSGQSRLYDDKIFTGSFDTDCDVTANNTAWIEFKGFVIIPYISDVSESK